MGIYLFLIPSIKATTPSDFIHNNQYSRHSVPSRNQNYINWKSYTCIKDKQKSYSISSRERHAENEQNYRNKSTLSNRFDFAHKFVLIYLPVQSNCFMHIYCICLQYVAVTWWLALRYIYGKEQQESETIKLLYKHFHESWVVWGTVLQWNGEETLHSEHLSQVQC